MSINELLLTEFDEEMKKTRTTLERVPEDKKDFTSSSQIDAAEQTCSSRGRARRLWSLRS